MSIDQALSVLPPLQLKIDLKPLQIELLTNRDIKQLFNYAYDNGVLDHSMSLKEEGRRIIYHYGFMSFLLGKQDAARESRLKYWAMEKNDYPQLTATQYKFSLDFFRLINDVAITIDMNREAVKKYLERSKKIVQMLIWTSYNQGKLALWDDELLRPTRGPLAAQYYKHENEFMFKTAADERVCVACAPYSGLLNVNPHSLPQPPLHLNCRCMLIAVPTVKVLSQQESFRKVFTHQQKIKSMKSLLNFSDEAQAIFKQRYDLAITEWAPGLTALSQEEYAMLLAWDKLYLETGIRRT